ncbi:DUF1648 domain-containing protein [Microbacteriaceae bacterium 4G12]
MVLTKRTRWEWIHDIICITVVIGSLIHLYVVWGNLPHQIATHYNVIGEADRFGSKWSLLQLWFVPFILYVGNFILKHFLGKLTRFPKNASDKTKEHMYLNSRSTLTWITTELILFFSYIQWNTIQISFGNAKSLGIFFVVVLMATLTITSIFFMARSLRYQ